ncbi:hypothetical protein GOP47_0007925 [Adiantum capillus-veneris]|uniref:Uncharacterized protein n=1 Tax=Adiantum capillus-veneris TaxID=13818 RepID=A0A9D4ZLZ4_ADICA|nr:hypothetical protein GOP47_0007925 [Adiantum capillus-veneris]
MKVLPSSVSLKRKHTSLKQESPLEQARRSWEAIRQLDCKALLDAGKMSNLPFPGIWVSNAWDRLPQDAQIVGVPDVKHVCDSWDYTDPGEGVMLIGSKGVGKSVRLRIFACIQYATLPKESRLLCVWNANAPVLNSMKRALLFTYAEEQDLVNEIEAIESLEGLGSFISRREIYAKETFSMLVDSAQTTDILTWAGEPQRDAEERQQRWQTLNDFLEGHRTIWGLSPKAYTAEAHLPHNVTRILIDEGFDEQTMQTFMNNSLLGSVLKSHPDRNHDINYYAGSYPWLLDRLDGWCWWCAWQKEEEISKMSSAHVRSTMSQKAAVALLGDPDLWDTVLWSLEQDMYVKAIHDDLQNLKVTQLCHSWEEMARLDSRYVLDVKSGMYCSLYIQHMYIDAVREHEQTLMKSQYGSWIGYCRYLLEHNALNWAEVGWACERLCTDVISKTGIKISKDLIIGRLPTQYFSRIPKIPDLCNGAGIIFIPKKFNFGSVDAVIIYQDTAGQLHFFGLQFTTSEKRHKHSEDEFMSVGAAEEWIPSVLQSSRDGIWKLHFVFVCLTSKGAQPKPERICKLRGNASYGVLSHTLHVASFHDVLDVNAEVCGMLMEIAGRREKEYADHAVAPPFPPLPSTTAWPLKLSEDQLKQLKVKQLRAIAADGGFNGTYRTRDLLVEAMKSQGLLLVE